MFKICFFSAALYQGRPLNIVIANESTSYEPLFSGESNHGNNTYVINVYSRMLRFIRIEKGAVGILSICEVSVYKRGKHFFDGRGVHLLSNNSCFCFRIKSKQTKKTRRHYNYKKYIMHLNDFVERAFLVGLKMFVLSLFTLNEKSLYIWFVI